MSDSTLRIAEKFNDYLLLFILLYCSFVYHDQSTFILILLHNIYRSIRNIETMLELERTRLIERELKR